MEFTGDTFVMPLGKAESLERDRARLIEALRLVFETREQEAKAALSARNAAENFSHPAPEFAAHARAAVAASIAENYARALLAELEPKSGEAA